MRTVGWPSGDVFVPALLLNALVVPVVERLLDVLLVPLSDVLLVAVAALLPKTATPVSNRRLCGGTGTVRVAVPLLAVVLLVPGVQEAAVCVPRAVPLMLPDVEAVPVAASAVPVVAVPLEVVPLDIVAVLLVVPDRLLDDEPLVLLAVLWQAARPSEATTAGTMVR